MKLTFTILIVVGLVLIVVALANRYDKTNAQDPMLVNRGMSDRQVLDQLDKKTIDPSHRLGLRLGIWFVVLGALGHVLMRLI